MIVNFMTYFKDNIQYLHTVINNHQKYCKCLGIFFLFSPEDMGFDFREKGREKERERNIDFLILVEDPTLTGDQTCNLGMCSDWELNLLCFDLWEDTQPSEPHLPGLFRYFTKS